MVVLSGKEIDEAKKRTHYETEAYHQEDDSIRIAYEWLDAQKKIRSLRKDFSPLKHIIEEWAGCYVSQSDVEVAAELHPHIKGAYPYYNISARFTKPSLSRLRLIPDIFVHGHHNSYSYLYKIDEKDPPPPSEDPYKKTHEVIKKHPTSSLMNPYRKLLVLGLNELLRNNLLSLYWDKDNDDKEEGYHFCTLADYPSVINWNNVGYGEVRFSVWWKYDHSIHPQANLTGNSRERFLTASPLSKRRHYPSFVGVVVSGWLERDSGKYIQGTGKKHLLDLYTRKGEKQYLEAMPTPEPQGYQPEGPFHL